MKQSPKMVLIDWIDSRVTHGWHFPDGDDFCHCQAVGILLNENETSITIILAQGGDGAILESLVIPKGCIESIKKLRIK